MTSRPLRSLLPALQSGRREARRNTGSWALISLLVVAAAVSWGVATTLAPDPPGRGGTLAEAPVPEGAWRIEWSRFAEPPTVEQRAQVLALRRVAAGTGGLITLVSLFVLLGLWGQRLRLRRGEDFVHWARGARRAHFLARLAGEGWRWLAPALALALLAIPGVSAGLARSFPGEFTLSPDLATFVLVLTGASVVLLNLESRAGRDAARRTLGFWIPTLSSPVTVTALGFAALTGAGLLAGHTPRPPAHRDGGPVVVAASLAGIDAELRPGAIADWLRELSRSGSPAGVAATGTLRGLGHWDRVWVECGACAEGGLPLPVRTVRAEVHAVAPDTFTRLGLALWKGRDFSPVGEEGAGAGRMVGEAVVSRALAGRHFENGEAVGRHVRVGESEWLEVVGVVDDRADLRDHTDYAVYVSLSLAAPTEVEVLAAGDDALDRTLAAAPAGVIVSQPRSAEEVFAVHRWFAILLGWMGSAALLAVAAGVGVGAAGEQRAADYEVGLRKALGARPRQLRWFFLGLTLKRLALALGVGAWLSLFLASELQESYGAIPLVDVRVWAATGAVLGTAFLVGAWNQFRRASAAMPVTLLNAGE